MAPADAQPFGKYDLLEKIASGGMAEIYRARYQAHAGVTKPLVIKKILPAFADNASFVSMFINEAKIAVGLSHGNIAQVFDFGEIEGEYFLAMEFVHGQPLSKVLKRAKSQGIPALPIPFALLIAAEMCKGLHYAHTRLDEAKKPLNIIHRDVSPQNVILSYEGQVKVVDFGIAKARTAGRTETEAGAVKGKYLYFSPEQARGKELDGRTDIFATAIVLYEMICGRLPFQGKMIEVLGNIVKGAFPRPREVNPDIPPALEEILLKAMAREREDRYPTAQAFGEALTSYLYAFAPSFSASSLQDLMTFLFEKELKGEGVPVRQSRELLEQVPLWRKPLRSGEVAQLPSGSRETAVARPSGKSSKERVPRQTRPSQKEVPAQAAHAPLPRWVFIGVPLLTALVGALAVFVLARPSTFTVQLASSPPGASISLDGRPLALVTPTTLSGLSAGRAHHLELTAPGMRTWTEDVRQPRGVTTQVFAQLIPARESLPVATPSTDTVSTHAAPETKTVQPVKYEASYPVDAIRISARDHVLDVPSTPAARVRLDPAHSYKVWARGRISLGGALDNFYLTRATYYLEGDGALPARDAFGMVGARPITVSHAKALYAFVFDETPDDNSGALELTLEDRTTHRRSTLLVDGRSHAIDLSAHRCFTLQDLSPMTTYRVRVVEGHPAARTSAGKLGEVRQVAYMQNYVIPALLGKGAADAENQVLEVGKSYEMKGVGWMRFVLLDDSPDDNAGELEVQVVPEAGSGGYLRGLGGR